MEEQVKIWLHGTPSPISSQTKNHLDLIQAWRYGVVGRSDQVVTVNPSLHLSAHCIAAIQKV